MGGGLEESSGGRSPAGKKADTRLIASSNKALINQCGKEGASQGKGGTDGGDNIL